MSIETNNDYDLSDLPELTSVGPRGAQAIDECGRSSPTPASYGDFDLSQWSLGAPGVFFPGGRSYGSLPSGFYSAKRNERGFFAETERVVSDDLTVLPGSCNELVLAGIRKFWQVKEKYRQHGLAYKRGVLLYGPPGSGKTATFALLCHELITSYDGVVFICQDVDILTHLLHNLRKIEPDRPLIVLMEDIDETIGRYGEHGILALLDGEAQIDNVVFIATTNYPRSLGARIINRPARFDQRVLIDMPSELTRRSYLELLTAKYHLPAEMITRWVMDTKGMSIAHLRELFVAVHCLEMDYEDVIHRLRQMNSRPRETEGFETRVGIGTS